MSAHLIAMCRAAQGFPASTVGSVLRADRSHEADRHVQPGKGGGVIDFLTTTQMILVLLIGLIAMTLLVFQLWAGRRDKAAREEKREGAG
ncbi:hypothetical protein SMIR_42060 (plasmid) [Streptomyces mirabilis]|uniref:hypothetical protein n=1 Tax=Streptomyces mirabilis TaxID=68239 RepID=UPI001BAE925C|nr:hypothetical protein [Streptomyces mirabilis]QUW85631.1 hypothetical protein SMIR_42060 [Streptomyces mirabilis]